MDTFIVIPELDQITVQNAIKQVRFPKFNDLCYELKTKGICSYK